MTKSRTLIGHHQHHYDYHCYHRHHCHHAAAAKVKMYEFNHLHSLTKMCVLVCTHTHTHERLICNYWCCANLFII